MKHRTRPALKNLGFCVILLAVSAGLGLLFYSIGFGEANIIMVILLAVLLISVSCGRTVGIAASFVSVVLFNYLFTKPRFTLVVHDTQYIITFMVMFIVALITSELTNRMKREAKESKTRAQNLELLYRTSKNFLKKSGTAEVVNTFIKSMYELLGIPIGIALYQNGTSHYYGVSDFFDSKYFRTVQKEQPHIEIESLLKITKNSDGTSTDIVSHSEAYEFPLKNSNTLIGTLIVLNEEAALEPEQRGLVEAVSAQFNLAFDREVLSKRQEDTRMEMERERLRSDLLRSISHDLRTPLTSITGASTTLLF
ncbi:MAG TPA: DUF4118 domain-containing protein [Sediminispirochaeta sp.]|nr:DUF4118 domain-containing protein [Sediminispirochaeta sp.]